MNWLLQTIAISATLNIALACNRVPQGTTAARSPVDENYVVSVAGNAQSYIPGEKYNISLNAYNGLTFSSFMLAIESENGGDSNNPDDNVGSFELIDLAETRFSLRCPNLIENTNTNAKTRVEVIWIAPATTGNGCIIIRATVVQHRDVWFMDDRFLSKKICEEEIDDIDLQPPITDPCQACNEAKYELTFEGKWSRNTHPKDFPANSWRTRFSDIIGASHTVDYRFWEYGKLASEGLREVAEHGSTLTLESELKDQSDQIRTIIKARGIAYPNVTGKTFAVFRVDSKHHLISLVSMVNPSPDWILGVSGLELCLPDGTWVENKVHNLYPWDVGTDSGPSYLSPDQPQVPPDVVRRIKHNFPNDPRSPFYDPSGAPMKPLATLYISRRRLYEKTCVNETNEEDAAECATYSWSRWDDCSAKCGPGKQYRTREFKNPTLANELKCPTALRDEQDCIGHNCGGLNEEEVSGSEGETTFDGGTVSNNPQCAISDWGEWSGCSVTCGTGVMTRSRSYLNPKAKKKCQKASRVKLRDSQPCERIQCAGDLENGVNRGEEEGEGDPKLDQDSTSETEANYSPDGLENNFRNFVSYSQKVDVPIPPVCGVSPWSDFSPCDAPCDGVGKRYRERKVWNNDEVYGVRRPDWDGTDLCRGLKRREAVSCKGAPCDSIVPSYCYETLQVSPCRDSEVMNYWFYDHVSDHCAVFSADKCDKNRNKFKSKEACEETCRKRQRAFSLQSEALRLEFPPVDCVVSEWQPHSCNATCGEGIQIKTRKVLRTPRYGGKPCPKYLVRLDKCYQRCDDIYSVGGPIVDGMGERRRSHRGQAFMKLQRSEQDDCRYSEWSAWSPCTNSCGDNSVRQKTRKLLNPELSYKCKDRVKIEKCVVVPCLLDSNDDSDRW